MKIGDKVVCVDDRPCACRHCRCRRQRYRVWLTKGLVYVISGVLGTNRKGTQIISVIGARSMTKHMPGYRASRFRLLDHLKEKTALAKCAEVAK